MSPNNKIYKPINNNINYSPFIDEVNSVRKIQEMFIFILLFILLLIAIALLLISSYIRITESLPQLNVQNRQILNYINSTKIFNYLSSLFN